MTARVLVAGIGNLFLGDDGFGPEVVRRLAAGGQPPPGVQVTDYGIRGMHLAYDLLDGWDALILVDALPATPKADTEPSAAESSGAESSGAESSAGQSAAGASSGRHAASGEWTGGQSTRGQSSSGDSSSGQPPDGEWTDGQSTRGQSPGVVPPGSQSAAGGSSGGELTGGGRSRDGLIGSEASAGGTSDAEQAVGQTAISDPPGGVPGGTRPGEVIVVEVGPDDLEAGEFDAHGMQPVAVLGSLTAMGGKLPPTYIVGCPVESVHEGIGLSPAVAAAVPAAIDAILALLDRLPLTEPLAEPGRS